MSFELLAGLEAMSVVQVLVSSSRYTYLMNARGTDFKDPGTDPAVCIDEGFGICGQHVAVFQALMSKIGIPTRTVQMWFAYPDGSRDSHIAAEVEIAGSWAYFDVTAGAIFLEDENDPSSILSFEKLRELSREEVFLSQNMNLAWTFSRRHTSYDLLYYTDAPTLDVAYAGEGVVHPWVEWTDDAGVAVFPQAQNFIGDLIEDGNPIGFEFAVVMPDSGDYRISYEADLAATCEPEVRVCVNGNSCIPGANGSSEIAFSAMAEEPISLSLDTRQDVCFLVVKQFTISPENP